MMPIWQNFNPAMATVDLSPILRAPKSQVKPGGHGRGMGSILSECQMTGIGSTHVRINICIYVRICRIYIYINTIILITIYIYIYLSPYIYL